MEKHTLTIGEIYFVEDDPGDFWMIGKHIGGYRDKYGSGSIKVNDLAIIINSDKEFKQVDWCYIDYNRTYRLANTQERQWLEACIQENRWMSLEEALEKYIPNYQIY